jgi:outer membrane receptor for ferrienterochelin and colicin
VPFVPSGKLLEGLEPLPYALFLPVSFSEIKRVEVSKGPAAAIYGFSAFHGIVNIITTDPDEMKGTTIQVSAANTVSFNIQPCMQAG